MKAFTHCPVCGDPLINNFQERKFKTTLIKYCTSKLNHKFHCDVLMDDYQDTVRSISLWNEPENLGILWYPEKKSCEVWNTKSPANTPLPYFEPDFSDYRKLISKIKIYILFS